MTKKQLLNLENLKIAEEKTNYFVHVHTNDGFYITDWKEDDGILKFHASTCIYLPIRDKYNDYRIINLEQFEAYQNAHKEAVEEERKKIEKNN